MRSQSKLAQIIEQCYRIIEQTDDNDLQFQDKNAITSILKIIWKGQKSEVGDDSIINSIKNYIDTDVEKKSFALVQTLNDIINRDNTKPHKITVSSDPSGSSKVSSEILKSSSVPSESSRKKITRGVGHRHDTRKVKIKKGDDLKIKEPDTTHVTRNEVSSPREKRKFGQIHLSNYIGIGEMRTPVFALVKKHNPKIISNDTYYDFDKIKKYIIECPAYLDQSANINFSSDGNKIEFGISLFEISASFPELIKMLTGTNPLKISQKDLISKFQSHNLGVTIEFYVDINKSQNELINTAEEYYKKLIVIENEFNFEIQGECDANETLLMALKNNRGLAIGESSHSDFSGKKILIDNMENFKKEGVTHIFLEHIFDDTQGEVLANYFANKNGDMPAILKEYLTWLDCGFNLNDNKYTFTNLVLEAKRIGIKIVPIDTMSSYSTGNLQIGDAKTRKIRSKMMNYVAAKQFLNHENEINKYLIFCGSTHLNRFNSKVPGMVEIMNCPTVVVEDNNILEIKKNPIDHIAKPNILIKMPTGPVKDLKLTQPSNSNQKKDILVTTMIQNEKSTIKGPNPKLFNDNVIIDTKNKEKKEKATNVMPIYKRSNVILFNQNEIICPNKEEKKEEKKEERRKIKIKNTGPVEF